MITQPPIPSINDFLLRKFKPQLHGQSITVNQVPTSLAIPATSAAAALQSLTGDAIRSDGPQSSKVNLYCAVAIFAIAIGAYVLITVHAQQEQARQKQKDLQA